MQVITFNSVGGCPAVQPGFDDHGTVGNSNRVKGGNARIQINNGAKVEIVRVKHIYQPSHKGDMQAHFVSRVVEIVLKYGRDLLLDLVLGMHLAALCCVWISPTAGRGGLENPPFCSRGIPVLLRGSTREATPHTKK